MSIFVYFDLTCDVTGDPEANKNKFRSTALAGLSYTVWILKIGPVVSEIGGELKLAPPPPSGVRYRSSPVGRGLTGQTDPGTVSEKSGGQPSP